MRLLLINHIIEYILRTIMCFNIYIASRKPVPKENLDAMVAESMKDINLEEEVSDGEDDPELLV